MPFRNPVFGGSTLKRQAIESPDYVAGTTGWRIARDGSAEFNDLTARGTYRSAEDGRRIEIDADDASNEIRFYSGKAAEDFPGIIAVEDWDATDRERLRFYPPRIGGGTGGDRDSILELRGRSDDGGGLGASTIQGGADIINMIGESVFLQALEDGGGTAGNMTLRSDSTIDLDAPLGGLIGTAVEMASWTPAAFVLSGTAPTFTASLGRHLRIGNWGLALVSFVGLAGAGTAAQPWYWTYPPGWGSPDIALGGGMMNHSTGVYPLSVRPVTSGCALHRTDNRQQIGRTGAVDFGTGTLTYLRFYAIALLA